MHTSIVTLTILGVMFSLSSADLVVDEGIPQPPVKPVGGFSSETQLKDYLQGLRRYYAVVSRPRFGKRDGRTQLQTEYEKCKQADLEMNKQFLNVLLKLARIEDTGDETDLSL